MKKGMMIILGVILLIVILVAMSIGRYNKMNKLKIEVENKWSQVENEYQRRFELIPNLVSTVQGAANFEKSTLNGVVEARAKVGQLRVDADVLNDPQAMANFQAAQNGLSSALSRLMAVVESYPTLTATKGFQDLQVQLEGTENRISTERMRFNDAVKILNTYIVVFPNNIFARIFGINKMQFYQAVQGAESAPKVEFNFE